MMLCRLDGSTPPGGLSSSNSVRIWRVWIITRPLLVMQKCATNVLQTRRRQKTQMKMKIRTERPNICRWVKPRISKALQKPHICSQSSPSKIVSFTVTSLTWSNTQHLYRANQECLPWKIVKCGFPASARQSNHVSRVCENLENNNYKDVKCGFPASAQQINHSSRVCEKSGKQIYLVV